MNDADGYIKKGLLFFFFLFLMLLVFSSLGSATNMCYAESMGDFWTGGTYDLILDDWNVTRASANGLFYYYHNVTNMSLDLVTANGTEGGSSVYYRVIKNGSYFHVAGKERLLAYYFDGSTFDLVDTYSLTNCEAVYSDGTYIYAFDAIGAGSHYLRAFDFDSDTYSLRNSYNTPSGWDFVDMCGNDSYIYACTDGAAIWALTYDGTSFSLLDSVDKGTIGRRVLFRNNSIYLTEDSDVNIFTFNGTAFTLVKSYTLGTQPWMVWLDDSGRYFFWGSSGGDNEILLYEDNSFSCLKSFGFDTISLIGRGNLSDGQLGYLYTGDGKLFHCFGTNFSEPVVNVSDIMPESWYNNQNNVSKLEYAINNVAEDGTIYLWDGDYTKPDMDDCNYQQRIKFQTSGVSVVGNSSSSVNVTSSEGIWVLSDNITLSKIFFTGAITVSDVDLNIDNCTFYNDNANFNSQRSIVNDCAFIGGTSPLSIGGDYNEFYDCWGADLGSVYSVVDITGDNNLVSGFLLNHPTLSSTYGIEISGDENIVKDSYFDGELLGQSLVISVNGDDNLVYNNIFINSSFSETSDLGSNNDFNIAKTIGFNIIGGPYIGGNYWDNYAGVDADADGIGDTAHNFDNFVYDYLPLTYNWVFSFPDPPYNPVVVYDGVNTTLNFSWSRGNHSDREVVMASNTGFGWNPWMGTEVKNSTEQWYNDTDVTSYTYYTVWSYNETWNIFSLTGLNIHWGAAQVVVYDENSTYPLSNYTIFISNFNGTEVYENIDASNPTYFSLQDIPHGNRTVFYITRPYYYGRLYYEDMLIDNFYDLRFYIPPLVSVVEEGAGDPGQNWTNTTQTLLYLFSVINELNDQVDDCYIEIRRYIDQVGYPGYEEDVYAYEAVSSFYSDGNGQHEVYLIPGVLYKVYLYKDDYHEHYADFVPDRDLRTRTFRLLFVIPVPDYGTTLMHNITWWYTPKATIHHDAFNFTFYIHDSDDRIEWYSIAVYMYNNSTMTWDLLYSHNETNFSSGGYLYYNFSNATGHYRIELWFQREGFGPYELIQRGSLDFWITVIQNIFEGNVPDTVFFIVLIIIMILVMAFLLPFAGISTGYIGIGIMTVGMFFNPNAMISEGISGWAVVALTFIMYSIGIFLWSRL